MQFTIQTERESDGRWIVEIPEIPAAMAYGTTIEEAKANTYPVALCSIEKVRP